MTPERENQIVNAMPVAQRKSVRKRLREATAAGWTSIGIWDGWVKDAAGRRVPAPTDEGDLFGVPPGEEHCTQIP